MGHEKILMLMAASLPAGADSFVKGADVGWLPQMEATGYKFRNAQGRSRTACRS
jgi:arabinogalactan endo-1,4-beta-galactosidase